MMTARRVISDLLYGADPKIVDTADFPNLLHKEIHRVLVAHPAGAVIDLIVLGPLLSEPAWIEAGLCMDIGGSATGFDAHVEILKRARQMHEIKMAAISLVGKLEERPDSEAVRQAIDRLKERAREDTKRGPRHISETLDHFMAVGSEPAVPFGISVLSPLRVTAGNLCVIAARPGQGKTAMLGTIAIASARAGWQAVFFSLEMPAREIQLRMVAALSGLPMFDVERKEAHNLETIIEAVDELKGLRIWLEDEGEVPTQQLTLETIAAFTRLFAEINADRPTVVLVDYLQCIRTKAKYEKRYELIGHICRGLKDAAKQARVPIIVGAQLGRAVEQRGKKSTPQLSDLRESGDIETTADQILMLHRENEGEFLFAVDKYRQGRRFTGRLSFDGARARFGDPMHTDDIGEF